MKYLPSSNWGRAALGLLAVFGLLQFIPRAPRNAGLSGGPNSIEQQVAVSREVMAVLKAACYDCHSNHTQYPWYSRVQPVAWWLDGHVRDGKETLNFDAFGGYSSRKRQHKLEAIRDQVEEKEMPLWSYSWMHAGARLTTKERRLIEEWAREQEGK